MATMKFTTALLIVSALRPALPDRRCPACGEERLRLLVPGEKTGVRCEACRHEDPELYVPPSPGGWTTVKAS